MKRRLVVLPTVLVLAASWVVVVLLSASPAAACLPGQSDCVGVGVGTNPTPGGGSTTPPSGGGSTTTDPCTADLNGAACAAENQARMCSAIAADWAGGSRPGDPAGTLTNLSPSLLAQLNADLAANGCPPYAAGGTRVDPATLAQQAAASFLLPHPSGHRSPSETQLYQGYPMTWVNLWTFYWTDPSTWKTLSATATAGAAWATVKATPVSLTYDPRGRQRSGRLYRPWSSVGGSDGNSAPNQGACGYQYRQVSPDGQPFTSTETIVWQLTWTGSGNTSGTLTSRTTSTSGQLQVLQIQAVACQPVDNRCPAS